MEDYFSVAYFSQTYIFCLIGFFLFNLLSHEKQFLKIVFFFFFVPHKNFFGWVKIYLLQNKFWAKFGLLIIKKILSNKRIFTFKKKQRILFAMTFFVVVLIVCLNTVKIIFEIIDSVPCVGGIIFIFYLVALIFFFYMYGCFFLITILFAKF